MMGGDPSQLDENKIQEEFDDFYEEIFDELKTFGTVEDVQVCENLGDHMVGNVYVKFGDEEDAEKALSSLFGRYYAGRPLACEYSPVTDFREARCRQFDEGTCSRGGYCNFMHVREPSRDLRKHLEHEYGFKGGKMKGTGSMAGLRSGGGGGGGGRDRYGPPPGDRGGYGGRDRDAGRDRYRDRGDDDGVTDMTTEETDATVVAMTGTAETETGTGMTGGTGTETAAAAEVEAGPRLQGTPAKRETSNMPRRRNRNSEGSIGKLRIESFCEIAGVPFTPFWLPAM
eukprot:CAMPEP_0185020360 /NCGR_PEP_ID=MMETSP1103-20130426/2948_1 /TAXON_ID=36769 /ORGANISM="Paraphysomonas bandaiensis, Strain Caron Lab Isolate" /LENGTH=284 /DNA_ID=CAMNT_0027551199 /DNA_START=233 /DNA_END=1088 /DNA_ORIENTATION=+